MLVSFSVSNYLSIRERAELSMLAVASDTSLRGNILNVPFHASSKASMPLLKSLVIYGPNASGKTNLLLALRKFVTFIIKNIDAHETTKLPFQPFALDSETKMEPSEFEIKLLLNGIHYRYGFSADNQKVYDEWLFASAKVKEVLIFSRTWDSKEKKQTYRYGPRDKRFEKHEEDVRNNALLLTVASQRNVPMAKDLLAYFVAINFNINNQHNSLKQEHMSLLTSILKYADIGITGLQLKPFEADSLNFKIAVQDENIVLPNEVATKFIDKLLEDLKNSNELEFIYKDSQGKDVLIGERLQSSGTRTFLMLIERILLVYAHGGLIIDDEIEGSLHPLLCEAFFKLFHTLPANNIQLICSTHNHYLLNADIFRRDQVWITEKDRSGNTNLYSLSEFKGTRKDAKLGKQYIDGRFGGLPILDDNFLNEFFNYLSNFHESQL